MTKSVLDKNEHIHGIKKLHTIPHLKILAVSPISRVLRLPDIFIIDVCRFSVNVRNRERS